MTDTSWDAWNKGLTGLSDCSLPQRRLVFDRLSLWICPITGRLFTEDDPKAVLLEEVLRTAFVNQARQNYKTLVGTISQDTWLTDFTNGNLTSFWAAAKFYRPTGDLRKTEPSVLPSDYIRSEI